MHLIDPGLAATRGCMFHMLEPYIIYKEWTLLLLLLLGTGDIWKLLREFPPNLDSFRSAIGLWYMLWSLKSIKALQNWAYKWHLSHLSWASAWTWRCFVIDIVLAPCVYVVASIAPHFPCACWGPPHGKPMDSTEFVVEIISRFQVLHLR